MCNECNEQLAIVIVSWNVRDLLARCLETLVADLSVRSIGFRVLVVANASSDDRVELVRSHFPQVERSLRRQNLGFAGGNNLGMNLAKVLDPSQGSDSILLLNPDTEVQPGAIAALLDVMHTQPQAAIVTSQLSYGDGSFQHSAFRFPGLAQLYYELLPAPARFYDSALNGRYSRRLYDAGQPFEIDTPLGAVMLIRTDAIRQVGLLDEGFALYCEEIDWAARFKEAGWKNFCAPAAHVIHYSGKSTSQVQVESFVKLWAARYRLHTRHPQFAPLPVARLIVKLGMRRRMRGASEEMRAACQRIIDVWSGRRLTNGG